MRYLLVLLLLWGSLTAQASAGASAAASQPAPRLQFKTDDAPAAAEISAPYIIVVLCLIGGVAWWKIRRTPFRKQPDRTTDALLQIVRHQRLSGKTVLHVIRYQNQELLLAEHGQGITVLVKTDMSPSSPESQSS